MRSMRTLRCGFALLLALAAGSLPVVAADGAVQTCQAELSDLHWLSGDGSSGSTSTAVKVQQSACSYDPVCPNPYCPGCSCCLAVEGTTCDPGPTGREIQCIASDNCVYNCECFGVWRCGSW